MERREWVHERGEASVGGVWRWRERGGEEEVRESGEQGGGTRATETCQHGEDGRQTKWALLAI